METYETLIMGFYLSIYNSTLQTNLNSTEIQSRYKLKQPALQVTKHVHLNVYCTHLTATDSSEDDVLGLLFS